MIELLALTEEGLNINTAVELRRAGAELGIKGASKGKKADLIAAIMELVEAAKAEAELEAEAKAAHEALVAAETQAPATPAKGMCGICGKRRSYTGPGEKAPRLSEMCNPCFEEGGWENTHSDYGHDANGEEITPELGVEEAGKRVEGCWICFPELNLAKAEPKAGRSRAGMVIVAKGTEIHKSETFRVAAETAGWTVTMMRETYELEADAEGEGTRYYATATKGTDSISLAWNGRAYDYPNSSALLNGKPRKVRNLKEALRLI